MSVRLVLKNVRLSYAHVWEPQPAREADRDPKFTTSIIIPKSDTEQIKKIEAAKKCCASTAPASSAARCRRAAP